MCIGHNKMLSTLASSRSEPRMTRVPLLKLAFRPWDAEHLLRASARRHVKSRLENTPMGITMNQVRPAVSGNKGEANFAFRHYIRALVHAPAPAPVLPAPARQSHDYSQGYGNYGESIIPDYPQSHPPGYAPGQGSQAQASALSLLAAAWDIVEQQRTPREMPQVVAVRNQVLVAPIEQLLAAYRPPAIQDNSRSSGLGQEAPVLVVDVVAPVVINDVVSTSQEIKQDAIALWDAAGGLRSIGNQSSSQLSRDENKPNNSQTSKSLNVRKSKAIDHHISRMRLGAERRSRRGH